MKDEDRRQRHAEITRAAYEMLALHGYGGASMLRIATAAKASNETLYRWYGDKDRLFGQMVRDNAQETRILLSEALDRQDDAVASLRRIAPVFLTMLLGDRAILLNRAAAADPSGMLGATISAGGREEVMPLLTRLMQKLCAGRACQPAQATDWFLGLLIGDLQIRRVTNQRAALSSAEIRQRCKAALAAFERLIEAVPKKPVGGRG